MAVVAAAVGGSPEISANGKFYFFHRLLDEFVIVFRGHMKQMQMSR